MELMPKKKLFLISLLVLTGLFLTTNLAQAQSTSFTGKFQLDGVGEERWYYFSIPQGATATIGYQTRGNTTSTPSLYRADGTLLKSLPKGIGGGGRKDFGTFGEGDYYAYVWVDGGFDNMGNAEVYFDFTDPIVPELNKEVEFNWNVEEENPEIQFEIKDLKFLEYVFPVKCPQAEYAIYDPDGKLVSKANNEETAYQAFNLLYPKEGIWTIKIGQIKSTTPYNPMKFKYYGGEVKQLGAATETAAPVEKVAKVFPWWWAVLLLVLLLFAFLLAFFFLRRRKKKEE